MTKAEAIIDLLKKGKENGAFNGTVDIAYIVSTLAHSNQSRDNGKNYSEHPKHCADMFYDLFAIGGWYHKNVLVDNDIPLGIVELAYLHDVVEDTELRHEDVKEIFDELGELDFFNKYIDKPLKLITHDKSEDYDTYLTRVMEHPCSAFVKMLDLADNLNLFGLGKIGDKEVERACRYIHYFKRINDKYHFLEKIKKCFEDMKDEYDS